MYHSDCKSLWANLNLSSQERYFPHITFEALAVSKVISFRSTNEYQYFQLKAPSCYSRQVWDVVNLESTVLCHGPRKWLIFDDSQPLTSIIDVSQGSKYASERYNSNFLNRTSVKLLWSDTFIFIISKMTF